MSKPKDWLANLPSTKCVFSDAVPVYCGIVGSKILVKKSKVYEEGLRKKIQKKLGQAVPAREHSMSAGTGKAKDLKDRLTFLARQCLEGLFGQAGEPRLANLRGKVLPSVLIVHCTHRVRLENISESGHWLEGEHFWEDGKEVTRKAGEKVPAALMKSWRELRKKRPSMFRQGVLIWGHLLPTWMR